MPDLPSPITTDRARSHLVDGDPVVAPLSRGPRDMAVAWGLPLGALALHLATYPGYGYFRDELYYLACGQHLGFGYVDHPPLIGVIAALVRATLGDSLFAIRLLPSVAAAVTVWMTTEIARELGGGRFAQALAGLSAMLVPGLLGLFGIFTMNAFDVVAWAGLSWIVTRYLRTGRERLWLAFGLVAGIGLENKVSVLFLGFGIAVGLALAGRWSAFRQRWLWVGGAIAGLLFLPHVIWQVANLWPTLEFMRNAVANKNVALSPFAFLGVQALNTAPAILVWAAGLGFLLVAPSAKPFRTLGWAYLVVLGVMLTTNAKPYYLLPVYPVLFASGGVALERLRAGWIGAAVRGLALVLVIVIGAALAPFAKAILPEDTFVRYADALGGTPPAEERHQIGRLPQHFADQHGWRELAQTVSEVYHRLPPDEQARACVYGQNYGQAGAIDFFGPRLGLPRAIAGHNSYFLWGPGRCPGDVLVIIGGRREDHATSFESVEQATTFHCNDCMPYENNRPIWIARNPKVPLQLMWPSVKHYD